MQGSVSGVKTEASNPSDRLLLVFDFCNLGYRQAVLPGRERFKPADLGYLDWVRRVRIRGVYNLLATLQGFRVLSWPRIYPILPSASLSVI